MKTRILRWFAKPFIEELERSFDQRVDQRVAKVLTERDPFEPLLENFKGTFAEEYERPEERLNQQGQIAMRIWGWQQTKDPSFIHITDWIMDKAGNQLIKKGLPSTDRQLFTRAQISTMLLLRKEASRLATLYEEMIGPEQEFTSDSTVD